MLFPYHDIDIFAIAFHEVFLPGKLFNGFLVGPQIVYGLLVFCDLLLIIGFHGIDLTDLLVEQLLPFKAVVVEEDHPDRESDDGDEIFVEQDFFERLCHEGNFQRIKLRLKIES